MTEGSFCTSSGEPSASFCPEFITITLSQTDMMALRLCSTYRTEVPVWRMSHKSSRIDVASDWVSPLQTSSQSKRLGRAARVRANSSRFMSPTERVEADI